MARRKPAPKQLRFILAYVACGNAAEAARRAGFKPSSAGAIEPPARTGGRDGVAAAGLGRIS